MGKTIKVDPFTMVIRTKLLSGNSNLLTETPVPEIQDIDGMPAAKAAIASIKELQKALENYQTLIKRDSGQIKDAVLNFVMVDKAQM